MPSTDRHPRVLVIDDNPAIHADIRKILCPNISEAAASVAELEAQLLDDVPAAPPPRPRFEVDSAHQGREGLALVEAALAEGRPYAVAFVDIRMPPGWDGVETTRELWKVAPDLQIVICTAYSDYSWDEILVNIGGGDQLVILKKPFDTIEVLQLANALTEKSRLLYETRAYAQQLEARVATRTADLQASNAALQAEIERRAAAEVDLKRAKEAAESADRAKSAFLANMSHEVRTPMNGVVGMANLLLNTPLSAEQREFAEVLCRSSDALLTVINDILDFSKIEAGSLELETIDFDLADPLSLALDLNAEAAAQKHIELVLDVDPRVPRFLSGDPTRLRQIVLNLVGNAVKFTARGEVVITVIRESHPGAEIGLRCEVRDSGIGIPPEVQARLFQPFVQGDVSTTRKYGGTGLGLAICKRLVELMGGKIGVVSQVGRGATFWFSIPLRPASDAARSATEAAQPDDGAPAAPAAAILVAEDNLVNQKVTLLQLRHMGYDADVASDGAEVLAALEKRSYDLILMDAQMPELDGIETTRRIRQAERDQTRARPVRIVALTASAMECDRAACLDAGMDDFLPKPIRPGMLRATLARHLPAADRAPALAAALD